MGVLNTGTTLLAESFLKNVKQLPLTPDGKYNCQPAYKGRVLSEAEGVLRRGIPTDFLLKLFKQHGFSNTYSILSFLKEQEIELPNQEVFVRPEDELIQYGVFYHHPHLHDTSAPPIHVLDWQTMEMTIQEVEPFYLEIVDSFTTEDLARHFLKSLNLLDELHQVPRIKKFFEPLVKQYGLDIVLYMIDEWSDTIKEGDDTPSVNTFRLMDYSQQAKERLNRRKDIAMEGGLMHVRPKEAHWTSLL